VQRSPHGHNQKTSKAADSSTRSELLAKSNGALDAATEVDRKGSWRPKKLRREEHRLRCPMQADITVHAPTKPSDAAGQPDPHPAARSNSYRLASQLGMRHRAPEHGKPEQKPRDPEPGGKADLLPVKTSGPTSGGIAASTRRDATASTAQGGPLEWPAVGATVPFQGRFGLAGGSPSTSGISADATQDSPTGCKNTIRMQGLRSTPMIICAATTRWSVDNAVLPPWYAGVLVG